MRATNRVRVACAVLASVAWGAGAAQAIVGGSADNGAHPYVGAAVWTQPQGRELCSGSLVSATVFVTAAHCFPDGTRVQITFDENLRTSSTWYTGTVHADPAWCFSCGPGLPGADTNDIAVVVLDGAGAPQPGNRYAQLPRAGLADSLRTNQLFEIAGFGVQSFVPPKTPAVFGTRHVATVKLDARFGSEYLRVSADPGDCFGDSGGPVLLRGTDVMVAIVSFGLNPICNGISYVERLDRTEALAFIRSFL
jgi:secreted trypsin-like serine protease